MQYTITKTLNFCSGHRLLNYSGCCRLLHGHNYKLEVELSRFDFNLDTSCFVIDFGDVKKIIGKWVDENWDHGLIMNSDDPLTERLRDQKLYLINNENPTAERMAMELVTVLPPLLPNGIKIVRIRVEETPGCWAEAKP